VEGEADKIDTILGLLKKKAQRGIVYAATRKNVETLTSALRSMATKREVITRAWIWTPQGCPGPFLWRELCRW